MENKSIRKDRDPFISFSFYFSFQCFFVYLSYLREPPAPKHESHVSMLMYLNYPYIVWNNALKFRKKRARSFRVTLLCMCVIVVSP